MVIPTLPLLNITCLIIFDESVTERFVNPPHLNLQHYISQLIISNYDVTSYISCLKAIFALSITKDI